jgi:hypothetical protein
MNCTSPQQPSYFSYISSYAKNHWLSLALFLTAYGAIFLSSVILNRLPPADWGKVAAIYSPSSLNPLLPRSFIDPIFFITSFPALLVGTAMLCVYSLRGISPEATTDKQYVAILLTAFGFTYQVVGAWPLQHQTDFPWQWQKQIISLGPVFAWTLYTMSLIVMLIGVVSLYKHSVIYHQKHPNQENIENLA